MHTADFQLIDQPIGSGHGLIVYGHTPTHVVVNDPWDEPDPVRITATLQLRIHQLLDPELQWARVEPPEDIKPAHR